MKKILLPSVIMASLFIVMGNMNAFQKMEQFGFITKSNSTIKDGATPKAKYHDCISEEDFPVDYQLYTQKTANQELDWDIIKVNKSLKKHRDSMENTLKNLSSIDAHNFLHHTFQKSKAALANKNISGIQKHYHFEIMRFCYESDKSLNQNSGRL